MRCYASAHGAVRRKQLHRGGAWSARNGQEPSLPAIVAYVHLVSGGKATVAKMFVNNANGQRGLVCQYEESVRCAEQNLYARAKELVGDRDPRAHEFTIQFRAFDTCKSAAATGIPILLALSSALIERSLEGGLVIVGGLNLGGSIEPIYNAVSIIELAADKGAEKILMPVSARKQLFELPDDLATKVTVVYYADAKDALLKALSE